MKIVKVISGGQTGADIAGLKAAKKCGIRTGGTAPKGFLTENGPNPELKEYGVVEHRSEKYPPRTKKNIKDSDITLIFAKDLDAGSKLTYDTCIKEGKPVLHISYNHMYDPNKIDETISIMVPFFKTLFNNITVNIAGNRESKSPGIEKATEAFLISLFKKING